MLKFLNKHVVLYFQVEPLLVKDLKNRIVLSQWVAIDFYNKGMFLFDHFVRSVKVKKNLN